MEVKISVKIYNAENSRTKGFATVTFDNAFKISNITIVESNAGHLFVSMPSYKTGKLDENGKDIYQDIAYPVTKEFRDKLFDGILNEYAMELDKSRRTDEVKWKDFIDPDKKLKIFAEGEEPGAGSKTKVI